jgi:hypothetical protein
MFGFTAKMLLAHEVNSYYTFAIYYCTFCFGKHNVVDPAVGFLPAMIDES